MNSHFHCGMKHITQKKMVNQILDMSRVMKKRNDPKRVKDEETDEEKKHTRQLKVS